MPMSWSTRILIATGILTASGYVYWRWDSKRKRLEGRAHRRALRKRRQKDQSDEKSADLACLTEYFQRGATLSSQVFSSLTYAQSFVDPNDSINLNPRTQARVFEAASRLARAGETGNIERTTRGLLREVLSGCPWARISWPFEKGSDWEAAYLGVEELLQLAALEMRYEDFHRHGSDGVRVGLICPGWKNMAPAPTANLKLGDFVELQVGVEDLYGEEEVAETVFAQVQSISGEFVTAVLVGSTTDLGSGEMAPPITGSSHHGYQVGDEVTVSRRCIHSLRKAPNR